MLRAVLLDVDGTLIDSNDAHARSYQEAFTEAGFEIPYPEVRWRIGMGGDRLVPALTGLSDSNPVERKKADAIRRRHKELFLARDLPTCAAFPRTRELLERLKANSLQLIVATSAASDEIRAILRQIGVEDLIDHVATSDSARSSKPAPDIVEAALAHGHLSADEAVMIGDTPHDIAAAHSAGVKVIALTCGGWDESDLDEAEEIYVDPAELLARLEGSLLNSTPVSRTLEARPQRPRA